MVKNFLSEGEAETINNMNKEAQNIQLGSAVKTALTGNIGWNNEERYYVDGIKGIDTQANEQGQSIDKPWKTIQYAVNIARYVPGTTTIDLAKNRRKYIFIMPGQYNEQILFSGYNISLIGLRGGNRLSNKDYGVTINYDGAVAATAVIALSGAGIEIAGITIHCNKAIPALYLSAVTDGCWIHDCYITGDDAKTGTYAINAESIKTTVIENNLIEGFVTGIDCGNAGGQWFYNCLIRNNIITKCTNGINIDAGAVAGQSAIIGNMVLGSSTSIVNNTAIDIIIAENRTKPALSDSGAAAGDNTTLA